MVQQLALFPLQIVVFPGEPLNLHIFEPRYRELVADAEQDGITFGVPTVIDGRLRSLGTEVTLEKVVKRYPSGESDISTRGGRIFEIESFDQKIPGKLYPGGKVKFLDIEAEEDHGLNARIIELTREIYRVLKIDKQVRAISEGFRTYDIAHYVGLEIEQEYELLTLRDARERQQYLIDHLETVRPDVRDQLNIRARAKLNGHFKELQPPDF